MIKIKICGVTNYDDAVLATNAGADYIGFNFVKESPRKVSEKLVKTVVEKLPPFVSAVGVFVNDEPAAVAKCAKKCGLKLIQLHGDETPDYCRDMNARTGLPVIKAFRVADEQTIAGIAAYTGAVQYVLLDAHVPDASGGTGVTFNWDLAVKAKECGIPVFLAGGLTPDNVADAVAKVGPFAVDVASGVERLPRRKDFDRLSQFVRRARGLK